MQWLNEPASWQRDGDLLRVNVDPGTDFWRQTGYGYVHDNGHVYGELMTGDVDVSVRIRATFTGQYGQAGIMLRAGDDVWLKSGPEFFEGRLRLSTVLTLGCSSWMVADLPEDADEIALRASRRGDAVEIRYTVDAGSSELAALVFLPPDEDVLAGVMCAAPEGPGFSVTFRDLRISGRAAQPAADRQPAAEGELAGWDGRAASGWQAAGEAGGWDAPGEGPGWPAPDTGQPAAAAAEPDEDGGHEAGTGAEGPDQASPREGAAGGQSEPMDAADEWISLLTADLPEE